MNDFKDKVVVITGASSGIGKALAYSFASEGSRLVISARNLDRLLEIEKEIKVFNNNVLSVKCDVSDESDCSNLIKATIEKFGTVNILVCNAGISMRALFETVELDVLRKLMDTNFWGTVYCSKYALPYLIQNKGSLVGISSIAGKKGLPGRTGYSSSKFAMEGFLETLRMENLKKGLHVLIACPNFTASEIRTKALLADGSEQGVSPRVEKNLMPAAKVAEIILKAIRKRKRDIILTPLGKLTVWVNYVFPSLVDKIIYRQMAKEPDSPFK